MMDWIRGLLEYLELVFLIFFIIGDTVALVHLIPDKTSDQRIVLVAGIVLPVVLLLRFILRQIENWQKRHSVHP